MEMEKFQANEDETLLIQSEGREGKFISTIVIC